MTLLIKFFYSGIIETLITILQLKGIFLAIDLRPSSDVNIILFSISHSNICINTLLRIDKLLLDYLNYNHY